ncbi:hypothetical protein FF1_021597 [Malus domestica]
MLPAIVLSNVEGRLPADLDEPIVVGICGKHHRFDEVFIHGGAGEAGVEDPEVVFADLVVMVGVRCGGAHLAVAIDPNATMSGQLRNRNRASAHVACRLDSGDDTDLVTGLGGLPASCLWEIDSPTRLILQSCSNSTGRLSPRALRLMTNSSTTSLLVLLKPASPPRLCTFWPRSRSLA